MSVVFESREHFLTYGYDTLLRDESRLLFERAQHAIGYSVGLANALHEAGRSLDRAADLYLETVARERV